MNHQLLALYGLKWNPFAPELPLAALRVTERNLAVESRGATRSLRQGTFYRTPARRAISPPPPSLSDPASDQEQVGL